MTNVEQMLAPSAAAWLADLDPRARIVGAVLFALSVVSLDSVTPGLLALVSALVVARTAGTLSGELLRRLVGFELFMLMLLLTLPFTVPGQDPWTLGSLSASREGLEMALLIVLRANAVVIALMTLVGTLQPVVFGHALGRLGVPAKLVHLLLMTVRQVQVLHDEFTRLRRAMRARAFVPHNNRHTWKSYGQLLGMLLVRSLERSRRILDAMRCRGFQGRLYQLNTLSWRAADSVFLTLCMLVCMLLLMMGPGL